MSAAAPDDSKKLGARIQHARLQAGLTQRELAIRVGTGERRIAAWEHGENEPSPGYALLLARELDQPDGAFIVDRPAAQRDLATKLDQLEDRLGRLESLVRERLGEDQPGSS